MYIKLIILYLFKDILYYNIQPIRYSAYYSTDCDLQLKLRFKIIVDDISRLGLNVLDKSSINLLQKIKYWIKLRSIYINVMIHCSVLHHVILISPRP